MAPPTAMEYRLVLHDTVVPTTVQSGTVALALNWPEATATLPLKVMLLARDSELTHTAPPIADDTLPG